MRAPDPRPGEGARGEARAGLPALTFEAGGHLFAVPARSVWKVAAAGAELPEGTRVVDAVGLLDPEGARPERACLVVLGAAGAGRPPVALTAARAREVADIDTESLLPLPAFLFRGANPFLGMIPAESSGAGRAVFLFGETETIVAAAGAA